MRYIKTLLLIAIPLILITLYALSPDSFSISYQAEKADLQQLSTLKERLYSNDSAITAKDTTAAETVVTADTIKADTLKADTLKNDTTINATATNRDKEVAGEAAADSATRVLLFGDSMAEGLAKRLGQYSTENKFKLMAVIWYGSSSELWSKSDTLEHFLRMWKPDVCIVTIGGNELFVKDYAKREKYVKNIVERLGNRPYVWAGTPKKDKGINDMIKEVVGDRYYDGRGLELARRKDKIHPTEAAAAQWMDSMAVWLRRHPNLLNSLPMATPTQKYKHNHRQILIQQQH